MVLRIMVSGRGRAGEDSEGNIKDDEGDAVSVRGSFHSAGPSHDRLLSK